MAENNEVFAGLCLEITSSGTNTLPEKTGKISH
jgi:hypothetical protein